MDHYILDERGTHMDHYILDEKGNPVPEPDLLKWAAWLGDVKNWRVARTVTVDGTVSTVFLGTDHAASWMLGPEKRGDPVLWETMIFGGSRDGEQWRHSSADSARRWHSELVEKLGGPAPGTPADHEKAAVDPFEAELAKWKRT